MFKKILVLIIIGTLIFITFGCGKGKEETAQIPSEGPYVRYVEVEERIPRNVAEALLVYYDENKLFNEADLIFKGVVIDEKEIGLEEYIEGELNITYYFDVFTFKIDKVYYTEDSSIKNDDVITVANDGCSNSWIKGTIEMKKDREYIVFAKKTIDTDTVKFSDYMNFFSIHYWMSIISIENGDYLFDEVFTSLKSGAKEVKIRRDGDFKTKIYKKGKEFEEELMDLISEKEAEE